MSNKTFFIIVGSLLAFIAFVLVLPKSCGTEQPKEPVKKQVHLRDCECKCESVDTIN